MRALGKSVRGEPARIELAVTQSQTWPEKEAGERGTWLWQREGFGEQQTDPYSVHGKNRNLFKKIMK